ncbi:MAG: hypothetical protein ACREXT_00310, partial [Gammaproteobacteria bacterium]
MIRSTCAAALCLLATASAVAAESDCRDLTHFDVEALTRYEFTAGGEAAALAALDDRRSYVTGEVRIVI